ncbi:MAG: CoA transferase [Dehalococcoidales bacterium]|nr:CoA transferase [Dehalococcoidales bacterium]
MATMPLKGLRVLDLSRVWAGPLLCRLLADFGAEVIKIEPMFGRQLISGVKNLARILPDFPNGEIGERHWNRHGSFNDLNRNKLGITLNLSMPPAIEIFKKLVKISDIVVENYTPRVMSNFGIDYPVLKEIKPELIMISMTGYGKNGPYRDYPAFGTNTEGIAGLTSLMGYIGGRPNLMGVAWSDPTAALNGLGAILTALWGRNSTGKGQYIDLSMAEATVSLIGETILGYEMNKKLPSLMSNRHQYMAPHGCYRCRGNDMWVAIAVASDEEWRAFCQVIGNPDWVKEAKFADQLSRWKNQDELDELIRNWTIQHDHYEVMHTLQAAGVACGAALTGKEILNNPHLKERKFFAELDHPDAGRHSYAGVPVKLSETPATFRMAAPTLGEHNEYVLGKLLGLSEKEISQLTENKVIGNMPPDPSSV